MNKFRCGRCGYVRLAKEYAGNGEEGKLCFDCFCDDEDSDNSRYTNNKEVRRIVKVNSKTVQVMPYGESIHKSKIDVFYFTTKKAAIQDAIELHEERIRNPRPWTDTLAMHNEIKSLRQWMKRVKL